MLQFYIDGEWVDPQTPNPFDVINPATEEVCGRISLGSAADVDKAEADTAAQSPSHDTAGASPTPSSVRSRRSPSGPRRRRRYP